MPKVSYGERQVFRDASLHQIKICNEILEDYRGQGYDITLRQLYYQMVARGYIQNSQREYKNLGALVNNARLGGLIDWNHIVDRTRNLRSISSWSRPADVVRSAAYSFHIDRWRDQGFRPEVWVEKDALVGVVQRAANEYDVPFFSCRGYTSQSEMWGAAMRLQSYAASGQTPVIIHLGDHDPSGVDMTRDIDDRLKMFMGGVEVKRVALNMDQVRKFNPPPNPAKLSDSRCADYVEKYGDESWELDALDPATLNETIVSALKPFIDRPAWDAAVAEERHGQAQITEAAKRWGMIGKFIDRRLEGVNA